MKKLFFFGLVSLQLTANAQWTHVPGASIEDISVGSATRVLGAAGGYVWYLNPTTLALSQSNVYNNFQQVTIAEDGTAWAKGPSSIYKATTVDGTNTVWNANPATVSLANLSCRDANLVMGTVGAGTNGLANIYTFTGTVTALLPGNGALGQVSIGTDGTLYGVYGTPASGNNVYQHNGSSWSAIATGLNQISVGDATHIVGHYNGTPVYYQVSTQGWVPFAKPNGSNVTDIEVAADGTIYALSSEWPNNVYRTTWGAVTGTGCPQLTTGAFGPAITGPETVCAGAEVTYTAAADANATFYTWTLGNGWTGTSTTNSITLTVPNISGQQLAFSVTASNECYESAAASWSPVVVTELAPFAISGQTVTCVGSFLAYSVVATGVPVTWEFPNGWVQNGTFPNNNGGQFTAGESGTISFTRDNGCSTRTETLEVNVVTSTPAPAVLASITALCPNEATVISINLDEAATGSQFLYPLGWTYQPDTDTSFTVTAFGNAQSATVTHQSTNVCGTTEAQFTFTKLTETSNYTFIQYYDGLLHVYNPTQGIGHQWLLNGDPIDGANGTTYQPLVNGTYSVQSFYNNYDCAPHIGNEVVVEELTVGITETAAQTINLYPNPATTSFTISGLTAGSTITLMDATGRIINTYIAHAQHMDVAASSLASGIYFVQQNTSPAVMKLVKH